MIIGTLLNPSTQLYLKFVAPKLTLVRYLPNSNHNGVDSILKSCAHLTFSTTTHGPTFLIGSGYLRNYNW